MSQVPAATRTLRVLRFLASQPDPVPLDRDHARVRAAAQHGVPPARRDDRRGLRGAPRRRAPLRARRRGVRGRQRLRPPGAAAADRAPAARRRSSTGPGTAPTSPCCTAATSSTCSRSARPGRPPLVTDVGVRLPAHLTASGRAILAPLPAAQVRALYPDRRGVRGPPRHRPAHASAPCARCSPRPGSAATPPRTARSPPGWPASPRPCSTTTATRSPGSR